jgi:hypothetical protein
MHITLLLYRPLSLFYYLKYTMKQQRGTTAGIFNAAKSNGARLVEETNINGDLMLQAGTKVNYD